MTGRSTAAELRSLVRGALRARLEPAGWTELDGRAGGPFALAAYVCPIEEGFAATAEVEIAPSVPDRPPVTIRAVAMGVSYEPLRRLWPLLGAFGVAVVHEMPRMDGEALFEVAEADDVSRVADAVAAMILDGAVAFARSHASLDGLLGSLRHDLDQAWLAAQDRELCVAALLAAAGRFDEARDALRRYRPTSGDRGLAAEERRIARQLRRWIDSGGDAALLPSAPPPSRSYIRATPSYSELRRHATLRGEAVAEVTRTGRGHDRDALRAMLQTELARRGIEESPHWIEQTLDHLWDTGADRVRLGLHGLKLVGRLGAGIAKAVRDRELPDISPPDWLAPPERAAYTVPDPDRSDRWIAVELDPGATDWLERAHVATPRLGATATGLHAWLDRDPGPAARFAVHLGERRVGTISGDAAAGYLAAMDDAEFRDELPNAPARLTRRETAPFWLLELPRPTGAGSAEDRD